MLTAPGRAGAVSSPGLLSGFIQDYAEGSRCLPSVLVRDGNAATVETHIRLVAYHCRPCHRTFRVVHDHTLRDRLGGPALFRRTEDEERLFLVPAQQGELVSRALSPADDDAELPDLDATATTVAEHRRVSRVFRLSHIDLPNGFLPLSRNQ